jgi:hypothetical protein
LGGIGGEKYIGMGGGAKITAHILSCWYSVWGIGHWAWGMGHGALGMGHWAWGIGHWAWGIGHFLSFPGYICQDLRKASICRVG